MVASGSDRYKTHMREPASIVISEGSFDELPQYGAISIAFSVDYVLEIALIARGLGGFTLRERAVEPAALKDYDAIAGNHPVELPRQFDLSNWALFSAWVDEQRVGGVIIAFDTDSVHLLSGRKDLAALWDSAGRARAPRTRRRLCAVRGCAAVGARPRVLPDPGRDAEHQRRCVPFLCGTGMRARCDPSLRLPRSTRRDPLLWFKTLR